MIAYIKGMISDVYTNSVVIENNNMGYNVYVSSNVIGNIGFTQKEVKLYTYLNVREDAMELYGFLTKEDLEIFKLLITVNGIGPKGAIAILGAMTTNDLKYAIMSGDSKALSKAPGIGAKTAGKIILELKDKIDFSIGMLSDGESYSTKSKDDELISEAVLALSALGYSQMEAVKAVRDCDMEDIKDVESLIKAALKKMI